MILDTQEAKCVIGVLQALEKGKTKYNDLFRLTKVSHTTLQRVLAELRDHSLISKQDKGHMDVDYGLTEKGKKLLVNLRGINKILSE
ncbi:MAG: winged helix-turn-helix transcriptional regulator [Nanoarchaeota archaeon]